MQAENNYPKPPFNTNYMQYGFALPLDIAKQVIGRNGCHFKRITQETRVSYIWYDSSQSVIEIWGNYTQIPFVIAAIENQIYYILNNILKNGNHLDDVSHQWLHAYAQRCYQWYTHSYNPMWNKGIPPNPQ